MRLFVIADKTFHLTILSVLLETEGQGDSVNKFVVLVGER
jgi:hypothetical protein